MFVLSILVALLIPMVDFKIISKSNVFALVVILASIFLMINSIGKNNKIGDKVLSNEEGKVSYDTQYGRVIIYNGTRNDENVRVLNIDNVYESVTYTDKERRNELVSQYLKFYDLMFNGNREIKDTLLIGGAGYSYPKYFISHYDTPKMDVVEIDGEITEIAKQYFYLDDLIKEYNLNENHRLNLITEDGRTYLNKNKKKYDAILNDAFSGDSPAKTLTTKEAISKIKEALNEDGLYLTNIISSLEGENSKFLRAEVNTLKKVFKNVYIVPCISKDDLEHTQNNMVIATDSNLLLNDNYNIEINENEITLTDDYCPVDTLIPQK